MARNTVPGGTPPAPRRQDHGHRKRRYARSYTLMAQIRRSKVREVRFGGFLISTDKKRIDLDVVHGFLTECYWAKGIPKGTVARSIKNSLCFGVYKAGRQVGFARVISDFATYGYIGDVFVLDDYRGRGLAKGLMKCIMEHPDLQGLR